jgi:hypothetical protein
MLNKVFCQFLNWRSEGFHPRQGVVQCSMFKNRFAMPFSRLYMFTTDLHGNLTDIKN